MVLVTGSTGLVGSHLLIHLLEKGKEVRAVYRNSLHAANVKSLFAYYQKAALFEKIEWFQADITDVPMLEKAFAGIRQVYHCAAMVSFDPNDEEQLRKNNIEGTANIVNLSLSHHVLKLCFVSSVAALGDLVGQETTITELAEWNPERYHSDYAISKYGAEMEIWRGQQEGLDTVIVNPGIILGPSPAAGSSGAIFSAVSKGLTYYTKGSTGFVGVEDAVKAMILLMESNITAERFILVSENISFDAVSRAMAGCLGVKPPCIYAPGWLTGVAWRADWLLSHLFFRKRRLSRSMAISLHAVEDYSGEKIKKATGMAFMPVTAALQAGCAYFGNQAKSSS